jgi:hypothetical protein
VCPKRLVLSPNDTRARRLEGKACSIRIRRWTSSGNCSGHIRSARADVRAIVSVFCGVRLCEQESDIIRSKTERTSAVESHHLASLDHPPSASPTLIGGARRTVSTWECVDQPAVLSIWPRPSNCSSKRHLIRIKEFHSFFRNDTTTNLLQPTHARTMSWAARDDVSEAP